MLVRADFYSLLGVDKKADKKQIKQAYRQAARKYHPVSGVCGVEWECVSVGSRSISGVWLFLFLSLLPSLSHPL